MKIHNPFCSECGGEVVGTVEVMYGLAGLEKGADGEYSYNGYTETWGDTQKTVRNGLFDYSEGDMILVQCADNHEWYTSFTE